MKTSKIQNKLRSKILEQIYVSGEISRIDIAHATGITPATTTSITSELIEQGIIKEIGESTLEKPKVGRKKVLLGIKESHSFYVGSEISEREFTYTLTDNIGTIIDQKKHILSVSEISNQGHYMYIHHLLDFLSSCQSPITAIGICLPGRYFNEGKVRTNNPLWKDFDLDIIKNSVDIPIFFANNVNGMSLAKRFFSNGENKDNFIYFHFRRGMHLSYMYEGKIYGRTNPNVGEVGHTIVQADGELCECGKHGCLQTFASESWLLKKATLLAQSQVSTFLKNILDSQAELNLNHLFLAYDYGEIEVINLLHQAIKYLVQVLVNLGNLIDANKIFIHSPLFNHKTLEVELYRLLNESTNNLLGKSQEILVEPYDDFRGSQGGAALAIYKTLLEFE